MILGRDIMFSRVKRLRRHQLNVRLSLLAEAHHLQPMRAFETPFLIDIKYHCSPVPRRERDIRFALHVRALSDSRAYLTGAIVDKKISAPEKTASIKRAYDLHL